MGGVLGLIRRWTYCKAIFLWDLVEDYVKNRIIFTIAWLLIFLKLGYSIFSI